MRIFTARVSVASARFFERSWCVTQPQVVQRWNSSVPLRQVYASRAESPQTTSTDFLWKYAQIAPYRRQIEQLQAVSFRGLRAISSFTAPQWHEAVITSWPCRVEKTTSVPDAPVVSRTAVCCCCYFVSSIFHRRFSLHSETSSKRSSSSSPSSLSRASFAAAHVARFG